MSKTTAQILDGVFCDKVQELQDRKKNVGATESLGTAAAAAGITAATGMSPSSLMKSRRFTADLLLQMIQVLDECPKLPCTPPQQCPETQNVHCLARR